jgi:hypothetical protein
MKFSKKEQRSAHRATVRRMAPDLFNSKVQTAHARLLRERRRTLARSLRVVEIDDDEFANPLDRQADLDAFAKAEMEEILYTRRLKELEKVYIEPGYYHCGILYDSYAQCSFERLCLQLLG